MWRGWRLSKSGSGHSGWARWATQAGGKAAHSGADAPLGLPGRGECELWGEGGLLTALGGTNWPWGVVAVVTETRGERVLQKTA